MPADRTGRSDASIEAERHIPAWLRLSTPDVRAITATVYDQEADETEALACTLRARAQALRVYDRRLRLNGLGICPYCEEPLPTSEPCQVLDPPHEGFYHEECAIALVEDEA